MPTALRRQPPACRKRWGALLAALALCLLLLAPWLRLLLPRPLFQRRAMALPGVPLTPFTEAYLASLPPADYASPLAAQREAREAAEAAVRARDGRLPMHEVRDVPPAGARPLLRVFTPPAAPDGSGGAAPTAAARPSIRYAHGGGWVLSSVATHDQLCRRMARAAGAVVVSVEYRLAPEHAYPAALDDFAEGYAWAAGAAGARGVVLAGDSAGGNLAAGLALRLRDEAAAAPGAAAAALPPLPLAMLLIYPALDSRCALPSYAKFAEGYGLTRAGMRHFWAAYLGGAERLASAPPYASPLQAGSLAGLPPALVAVAAADVLHDEGVAFYDRLVAAGGRAELTVAVGQVHGFIKRAGNPEGDAFVEDVVQRAVALAMGGARGAV